MTEPRAYTEDEVRDKILSHMRDLARYWSDVEGRTCREKIEGALFSTLSMLDGSGGLCAFKLVACSHPDDKEYLRARNENWIEPGTTIDDCLHEHWHKKEKV